MSTAAGNRWLEKHIEDFECEWFAGCAETASAIMAHPAFPETGVPICSKHRAWCARMSDGRSEADIIASVN